MKISNIFSVSVSIATLMLVATILPSSAQAAVECTFTRNLEVDVVGDDVRCLQKYLNSEGFTIATNGTGSPGNETNILKDLTKKSISKWQAANGLPATGYFGELSRKKYIELLKKVVPIVQPVITEPKPTPVVVTPPAPTPTVSISSEDKKVREAISKALQQIEDSEDEVDDYIRAGNNGGDAQDEIEDAEDDILDAMTRYFKGDLKKALERANSAYENAIDAFEKAGGESAENETDEYIDTVNRALKVAKEKIKQADKDDKDVEDAEKLISKAEARLKEAKTRFDDEDYEQAEDLADSADKLIEDAVDAIGSSDKTAADKALKSAKSEIDDAWEEVEDADNDGDDLEDAKDLLDAADSKYSQAKKKYNSGDYDDAKELANDARDLARDALDEI